jgi:hypothetical protein
MFKNKTARVTAFIGALGASAALIGTAATTTGAYFTDAEDGNISGSSGHLSLDKRNGDYQLAFNNLVPGEYQDKEVFYATGGDTASDVWLKFPSGEAYGKFTGAKGTTTNSNPDGFAEGGMGRFGHFAVARNDGGVQFSSYNLQNESNGTSGCADGDGHGFGRKPVDRADTPPLCGVPHYIKLESNVPAGSDRKFTITFGVTGRQTTQGQTAPPATVPFQVVATQHGVRPDAENF